MTSSWSLHCLFEFHRITPVILEKQDSKLSLYVVAIISINKSNLIKKKNY